MTLFYISQNQTNKNKFLSVICHHRSENIRIFVDKRDWICYWIVYIVIYSIEHFILGCLSFLLFFLQLDLQAFAVQILLSSFKPSI